MKYEIEQWSNGSYDFVVERTDTLDSALTLKEKLFKKLTKKEKEEFGYKISYNDVQVDVSGKDFLIKFEEYYNNKFGR